MLTEPWFTVYMKSVEELRGIAVRVKRGTRNTDLIDLCTAHKMMASKLLKQLNRQPEKDLCIGSLFKNS